MPDSALTTSAAWAWGALAFLALVVYAWQIRCIVRDGGKVRASDFDLPELLMSLVFAGFFAYLTIATIMGTGGGGKEPAVKIEVVLPVSLEFIVFVAAIGGFMWYRGLRLVQILGLARLSGLAAVGWSVGLILAAFPVLQIVGIVTKRVLRDNFEPQPLVSLFSSAAHGHDFRALGIILLCAVVIQPACEEFLFRGFFYGVWKRYVGPLAGGFCASLLFAAFHTSLTAFATLFVLAVCLNIAYERTGSLLVPILMHALFNLVNLLVLFWWAQSGAT